MRRKSSQPEGWQPESQERVTGSTGSGNYPQGQPGSYPQDQPGNYPQGQPGGATGATGTGMQGTGGTYQQSGTQTGTTTGYARGQAPAPGAGYPESGYYGGRPNPSRHGAALAILAGSLAFLEGLAFVIRSHYYSHAAVAGYAYRWNLHGWGWTLLILGAILFAGGMSHFLGIKGSRHFTAIVAVITAVVAFITIFYSVIWGIVVLAACAFAAHALLSHRSDEGYASGPGSAGYGGGRDEAYQAAGQRGTGEEVTMHRRM